MNFENALTVGAGDGLSVSLTYLFSKNGIAIGLAARNTEKHRPFQSGNEF